MYACVCLCCFYFSYRWKEIENKITKNNWQCSAFKNVLKMKKILWFAVFVLIFFTQMLSHPILWFIQFFWFMFKKQFPNNFSIHSFFFMKSVFNWQFSCSFFLQRLYVLFLSPVTLHALSFSSDSKYMFCCKFYHLFQ